MLHGVGLDAAKDLIQALHPQLITGLAEMGRPHFNHIQLPLGLNTEGSQNAGGPSATRTPSRVLTQSFERKSERG